MNETGADHPFELLGEDTVKLDDYIVSSIPDAVLVISRLKECPARYLYVKELSEWTQDAADGSTVLRLPPDFIRLVGVRLEGWKREVQTIRPYGDEEYRKQQNAVTRAGVNKPVCVFSGSPSGEAIACFPSGPPSYARYVARLAAVNDPELSRLGDALFPSICHMCASLVYTIFENPSTAGLMKTTAIEMLPTDL